MTLPAESPQNHKQYAPVSLEELLQKRRSSLTESDKQDILEKDGISETFTNDQNHWSEDEPDELDLMNISVVKVDNLKVDYNSMAGYEVDDVKIYLKEIGRFRLLNGEMEVKLFRDIERGNLKAKEMVINSNYRLVVNIAKQFRKSGVEFLDLIQAGNEGLLKAVDRFDYHKGFKFSTYATWWIRQSITRYMADHARVIRIPVHMVETLNKLKKYKYNFTVNIGRKPTNNELATAFECSEVRIEYLLQLLDNVVSLDSPVGEDGDTSLGDFIEQKNEAGPFEAAAAALLREQLGETLETLTLREKKVLELRFGLIDGRTRTLEEVGQHFGVTRERIRQIEAKALRKLRHPSRAKRLKDFWLY